MYITHVPNEHTSTCIYVGVVTEHVYVIYVRNVSTYVCMFVHFSVFVYYNCCFYFFLLLLYLRSSCVEVKCTNPQALIQKLMIDRVRLIGGEG